MFAVDDLVEYEVVGDVPLDGLEGEAEVHDLPLLDGDRVVVEVASAVRLPLGIGVAGDGDRFVEVEPDLDVGVLALGRIDEQGPARGR
ncbi:hypothetical protein, partial [Streptomyces sp. MBT62]|uniref:hypothetical protein n=1 Tax=Streptomyces sp. MBT62 TaxID=2800410 RepID=UPI001F319DCB